MSKSAGETRTTSTTGPAAFQKPYLEGLMQQAAALYGGRQPTYYPGNTVAPFTETQQRGMEYMQNVAPYLHEFTKQGMSGVQQALSAPNVGQNPYVHDMIRAAQQPIWEQLTENVLPQLRHGAVATGNRGSSRESIASANAFGEAADAAANSAAQILYGSYGQGLQTMLSGMSQIPGLTQNALLPGQVLLDTGQMQQNLEQAKINEAIARHEFEQQVPYRLLQDYARLVTTPYGGESVSLVQGTPPDKVASVLSMILGALGIGKTIWDWIP